MQSEIVHDQKVFFIVSTPLPKNEIKMLFLLIYWELFL